MSDGEAGMFFRLPKKKEKIYSELIALTRVKYNVEKYLGRLVGLQVMVRTFISL